MSAMPKIGEVKLSSKTGSGLRNRSLDPEVMLVQCTRWQQSLDDKKMKWWRVEQ